MMCIFLFELRLRQRFYATMTLYSMLLWHDPTRRTQCYSTLLDTTQRYLTLQDTTLTLLNDSQRYTTERCSHYSKLLNASWSYSTLHYWTLLTLLNATWHNATLTQLDATVYNWNDLYPWEILWKKDRRQLVGQLCNTSYLTTTKWASKCGKAIVGQNPDKHLLACCFASLPVPLLYIQLRAVLYWELGCKK